jgi:hypothetical protein
MGAFEFLVRKIVQAQESEASAESVAKHSNTPVEYVSGSPDTNSPKVKNNAQNLLSTIKYRLEKGVRRSSPNLPQLIAGEQSSPSKLPGAASEGLPRSSSTQMNVPTPDTIETEEEQKLALALGLLLEDVYILLELNRELTAEEWNRVGMAMQAITALCPGRNLSNATPSATTTTMLQFEGVEDSKLTTVTTTTADAATLNSVEHNCNFKLMVDNASCCTRTESIARNPGCPSDLENLLNVIEKVQKWRLDDQSVALSPKQKDNLDLAAAEGLIARLTRGRLEDQRATRPADEKARIVDMCGARPQLANQRVQLSASTSRKMDIARLGAQLDRLGRNRMYNQDAMTKHQRLVLDVETLCGGLQRMTAKPMAAQRYELSEEKEKHMFFNQIGHRISRLTDTRMNDQSTESPEERKKNKFNEVDLLMDRLTASKPGMERQRFNAPGPTPN